MNAILVLAKEGSIGLPGKNIWKIKDRTLLGWLIQDAQKSQYIDKIFVSTNGEKIADLAHMLGAEVIRRDDELAKNEKALDAIDHGVSSIRERHPDLQIIGLAQCVVHFRDPDIFDKCFKFLLENKEYDSAVTIRQFNYIPGALMKIENNHLVPCFPKAQEEVSFSRQNSEAYEIDHMLECFTYDAWLKRENGIKPWPYLGRKIKGIKQTYHNPNCYVDVHTKDDIVWLEFLIEHFGFQGMKRDLDPEKRIRTLQLKK